MTSKAAARARDPLSQQAWLRWLVVGFIAGAIFVLMAGFPGAVPVPDVDPPVFGLDKWLHFGDYLVLGAAAGWALSAGRHRPVFVRAFLGTAAYGVGLEVLQLSLAYRSFELGDVAANLVGAAVGAGFGACSCSSEAVASPRGRPSQSKCRGVEPIE